MNIGGLQKTTLIDYPGKIGCTVFLTGCNFRCPWCQNPELVLPEKIKKSPKISEKDFFNFLEERKGFLEGVCITGGEPTIHKDLPNFIKKIKKLGFAVKLDTNGSNPRILKNLIKKKLIDYIAMDVKAPLKNPDIKKSVEIIKNSSLDYEFRTTVVPTVHNKEDIIKIARELSKPTRLRQGFGGQRKYYLQNFRPEKTIDPKFKKIKPFNQKQLESIQKECQKYLPTELRD
jgi:pyruvate formate lyase activating enzyme